MRPRCSTRSFVLATPLVLFLGWSGFAACRSTQNGLGLEGHGSIVTVAGSEAGLSVGTLIAYESVGFRAHTLDDDVYGVMLPLTPPQGRVLPYVAEPEYAPGDSTTRTVDALTGEPGAHWEGAGAIASDNMVAFCRGKELLIAPLAEPSETIAIQTLASKTACVQGAWHGDTFAFLTIGSPATGGSRITLQLWEGGSLSSIPIDVPVFGVGPVSWSPDGTKLIYTVDDRVVQVTISDEKGSIIGAGASAKFSPMEPNIYSAITAGGSVEVRQTTGEVVAAVRPARQERDDDDGSDIRPDEIATAWSPDGGAIAIITPDCLSIWDFRSGNLSCKVHPPQKEVFQAVALWFPPVQ